MVKLFYAALGLFFPLCLALCGTILLQESKHVGLGASFGWEPANALFGTATARVLGKITAWLTTLFLGFCLFFFLLTTAVTQKNHPQTPPDALQEEAEDAPLASLLR